MFKILLLLSLLLFGCSLENDGPISIYEDDDLLAFGDGFFYAGALDTNEPIHLYHDSLSIFLDSIWTFSNCSLSEIEIETSLVKDTLLYLSPRFIINPNSKDCAAPLFRPDTTIFFSLDSYKKVREVRLLNTNDKELDSIFVRHGSFSKEIQSFYIDSAIANPSLWPFRISNDSAGILRVLDSVKVTSYYWKPIFGECAKIHDDCSKDQSLDTLFPSSRWDLKDTALIPVIRVCEDTSKTYCSSSNWAFDSLNTGKTNTVIDTTRFSSMYYIADIDSCSELISLELMTSFALKSNFSLQTNIFIPSSDDPQCNEELISDKIIYNLGIMESVQDIVKAKELLDQWDTAYVVKSLDQEK